MLACLHACCGYLTVLLLMLRLVLVLVGLDRFADQGYCLVEFEKKDEAQLAIDEMDGSQLLEQDISVTWAFVRGGESKKK